MIRFAKKEDTEEIISLWGKSFKEDEFSRWYFDNKFSPENTIVNEEKGIISSMLQRLAYEIKNIGEVTYIFGACTHPDYRNQGLMTKMLEYSEKIDKDKNIKASVLIPQEESLFKYYENLGYVPKITIFNKKYIKRNPKQHSYTFRKCDPNDIKNLNQLYETDLENTNYVERNHEFWATQFSMFEVLGGNVFCLEYEKDIVGYAFCWNDDEVVIQEMLGINHDIKKILCYEIMKYFDTDTVDVFSLTGTILEVAFASIKEYEPIQNHLPIIMNLMYN